MLVLMAYLVFFFVGSLLENVDTLNINVVWQLWAMVESSRGIRLTHTGLQCKLLVSDLVIREGAATQHRVSVQDSLLAQGHNDY